MDIVTFSGVETLQFQPMRGLSSPHLQTVLANCLGKGGVEPPSAPFFIPLEDGDTLFCSMSTPPSWNGTKKTVLLIHGLGGSYKANYMIRMCRKLYLKGLRVVRLNLRGTGPGASMAQRPYHGGSSHDLLQVLLAVKKQAPLSPLVVIGYSLGGNIALKLLGELGEQAEALIETTISVCAPIDLEHTIHSLSQGVNHFYHKYYVKGLKRLGRRWIGKQPVRTIIDFDHVVTAPQWGFKDAYDYYRQSSSCHFLPRIRHSCHLIFAADDPFVDYRTALIHTLPSAKIWLSKYGGHMGFWGWAGREHGFHWLDRFLLELVKSS